MPNLCSYALRIKGTPEAIAEMEARLTDYDHKPHFWRVFEAYRTEIADGVVEFSGTCAWSVASCMCEGAGTYADSAEDRSAVTSLAKTAKELHATIEVFSEEPGCAFSEHFLYDNEGTALIEDTVDFYEVWWDRDEYPTFAEFAKNEETYGLTEKDFGDEDYATVGGFDWEFDG